MTKRVLSLILTISMLAAMVVLPVWAQAEPAGQMLTDPGDTCPCGEAWEFVRQGGYDQLCARLGKGTDHQGDFYHDGDIGGGQYLNACVWFEMITGLSCVGNSYVPTYVYGGESYSILSDITIEQLQEAAHRAVEELPAQ